MDLFKILNLTNIVTKYLIKNVCHKYLKTMIDTTTNGKDKLKLIVA